MTKRRPVEPGLRASALASGAIEAVATDWRDRLSRAGVAGPAGELYGGRNFKLSQLAANATGSPFFVVSAGLGLVRSTDLVPAYSMTVSPTSPDSVLAKIKGRCAAADWWRAIGRGSRLATIAELPEASPILVALPGTYLAMVGDELETLNKAQFGRVRIFTRASVDQLDEKLRSLIMPYDRRLDGPDSPQRGTMTDFAGRALADFVKSVLPGMPNGSTKAHRQAVERRLASWRTPVARNRQHYDDETILRLIRKHWEAHAGRSSKLLRLLRDELEIACAEGRFRRLADQVATEIGR